jgi:hypothetical protein
VVNREVPDDVARLLSRLDSAAEVEVLIFLHGRPLAEWTGKAVADLLLLNRETADAILARLHTAGLVTARPRPLLLYQYGPTSDDLGRTVDRLAEMRAQHPLLVAGLAALPRLPDPRPGACGFH